MKKINVCFDGTVIKNEYAKDAGRTGIFFVAKNILTGLRDDKNINLALYFDKEDKLSSRVAKDFGVSSVFTNKSDFSQVDAFFSPAFKIPEVIGNFSNVSCYTVLYDVIPLLFPNYFKGNAWFHDMIKSLNNDDHYFAISEYTKNDFLKYFAQINKKKFDVVLLSTNQEYKPCRDKNKLVAAKKKYHIAEDKKYLFSLCTLEPRKNLIKAVKSFIEFIKKNKIEDLVYVLGGGAWDGFVKKMQEEVPEYRKYQDKIVRAGYVDDEDLEVLYSNAEWFVYTSEYEGFGMPPLEAMKCGCPVITSDNSSLPEVVGEAGIMIDCESEKEHVAAYEKYYYNEDFRQNMAQKGLKRSLKFSWQKCIDKIVSRMIEVEAKKSAEPKVTIITPVYNLLINGRKKTFIQNMESVQKQTYKNIEHLVIDGASTDGTIEMLEEYQKKGWIKYYTEPDKGIYDAMNKGILKAEGKYVVCLNSDDFYCNEKAVELEVMKLEENEADACYGNSMVLDEKDDHFVQMWSGKNANFPCFGEMANHQTFMIKTDVMKELGLYNLSYKVSADSNFVYNLIAHDKKLVYVNAEIIGYRRGGFSEKNESICLQNQEDSFNEFWGEKLHLTRFDIKNLAHNNFIHLPLDEAIVLGSKLGKKEWISEYFRRLIANMPQVNTASAISSVQNVSLPYTNVKYSLFSFIPLLKIYRRVNKVKYFLFDFIPLYKYRKVGGKRVWKVLGMPVFKIRKKASGTVKYYLFGVPVLKICTK